MKTDDGRFKLYIALAIILGALVIFTIYLVFRKNVIDAPSPKVEEVTIMELPGLGEESDPLKKKEADVDIKVTPQYNGSFSWDKIGEWLEDPSELIDNTSINIEGKIQF